VCLYARRNTLAKRNIPMLYHTVSLVIPQVEKLFCCRAPRGDFVPGGYLFFPGHATSSKTCFLCVRVAPPAESPANCASLFLLFCLAPERAAVPGILPHNPRHKKLHARTAAGRKNFIERVRAKRGWDACLSL
jgi:hypothetical protein